jgi:ribosome-associated translation inhibitor RaiA
MALKIEIVTKNVENDSMVREYIQQKVHFAMGRIGSRVKCVTVRLEDETKDSGSFDGNCRIEIDMKPRGHIHVSSKGESAFDCVLQAIRKMEHASSMTSTETAAPPVFVIKTQNVISSSPCHRSQRQTRTNRVRD